MKKKLVFYLDSLSGGGAERTVINIINNLDINKYEILLVLAVDYQNDYLNLVNSNIKVMFLNSDRADKIIYKLSKFIRRENPDLLFSTMNGNNLVLLLAKILSLRNVPVIVREASNRSQSNNVTVFNKLLTFLLYNFVANRIISLSKGVKTDLVKNFRIRESKIKIIYNPIEIDKIKELSKEKVKELDIFENKVIVSIGRLTEQKDYPTLIRAFKEILRKKNTNLIILGKGPDEKKLKKLVKEYGIQNNVYFLGFQDNPYKYLHNADLFILSSKWEGFGHVIVEAMVTNTPVIATDCKSGPREIIRNNQYGLLTPVGDYKKIAEYAVSILDDSELRKKYSSQGAIRSKDFKATKITKQYEKLFNNTLSDNY